MKKRLFTGHLRSSKRELNFSREKSSKVYKQDNFEREWKWKENFNSRGSEGMYIISRVRLFALGNSKDEILTRV